MRSNGSLLKNGLAVLLCAMALVECTSKNENMNSEKQKSIIKTITGTTQNYSRTDGKPLGSSFRSSLVNFDVKGNKTEETTFYQDGTPKIKTEYDSLGKIIEETHYDGNKKVDMKYIYAYSANQIKKTGISGEGESLDSSVQKLNASGSVAEEFFYKRDGSLEVTDQYEYDKDGKLIEKKRGNVADWKYTYDERGNLTGVTGGYFSADESDDSVMRYDEHNSLKEKTVFFLPGKIKSVTTYSYEYY